MIKFWTFSTFGLSLARDRSLCFRKASATTAITTNINLHREAQRCDCIHTRKINDNGRAEPSLGNYKHFGVIANKKKIRKLIFAWNRLTSYFFLCICFEILLDCVVIRLPLSLYTLKWRRLVWFIVSWAASGECNLMLA